MKVQTRDPKKVYLIDNGLRTVSLLSEREDWGRLAENIVYIELRRRNKQVFYYKNEGEVDFLVTELGKPQQAIQVCLSDLEDEKMRQRELSSLQECLQALHLSAGILLTKNHEETLHSDKQTVRCIPLYRWLLDGES